MSAEALPRGIRLLARLIPAADRESILGDLLEDAACRDMTGPRLRLWLLGECAAIAAGLAITRLRHWLVVPPMREVAAGLAVDGRGAWRGAHRMGAVLRALIFCGSVGTIVLGVELLVGSLLSAAGF
jgi:hypothetical protein